MEIRKSDLKHEDPTQDIIWEDNDLIVHLKDEMIRLINAHPAKIIFNETGEFTITIIKERLDHGS